MIKLSSKCLKKFVFSQGTEPRLPALIFYIITSTPLRMVYRITKITNFDWVCLLASRWGLGSNLLGSPSNIAI